MPFVRSIGIGFKAEGGNDGTIGVPKLAPSFVRLIRVNYEKLRLERSVYSVCSVGKISGRSVLPRMARTEYSEISQHTKHTKWLGWQIRKIDLLNKR